MLLPATVIFSSFQHPATTKGAKRTVNISGTRFFFPLIERWAEEFEKEHKDIDIVVQFGIKDKDIEATGSPITKENPDKGQYTTVSRFALVPIINAKNPAWSELQKKGLSKNDFEKIYFKNENQQSSFVSSAGFTVPIRVYTRGACASATFSKHFGKELEELSNLDTKIADDKVLLENILNDSLGVAYNNLGFVYDLKTRKQKAGIKVVPIDLNASGKIEHDEDFYGNLDQLIRKLEVSGIDLPPTGKMVFIHKGNKPEVKAFVDWILAKGQNFNHEVGFLNNKSEATALAK
jgi:phosphate transport system substrate-binding protein